MTGQPKTPGAMVLVPLDDLKTLQQWCKARGWNGAANGLLNMINTAAPAEQTPAVGGDVPRYMVYWNDQDFVRSADYDDDLVCRWKDVAPLLADIERWRGSNKANALAAGALVERLQARIAELEAQQGEPVLYVDQDDLDDDNFVGIGGKRSPDTVHTFPLYRQAQPATAKVVLPEREDEDGYGESTPNNDGWNACLDEIAKLNP